MKNFGLVWISGGLFFTTACSTLNPFHSERAEDYNAITYGNEDNGRNRNGAWGSARDARLSDPYERAPERSIASVSPEKQDSYYEEQEQQKLDPSDEEVRNQIESQRGYTNSGTFVRGDRATRTDFYDNVPSDGSLWANQNDANYFFTKDKLRSLGDIISIRLEQPLIKQIAEEVKKSLAPAEQEVEMALYLKNSNAAKNDNDLKAYRNIASDDLRSPEAEIVKTKMEKAVRWSQVDLTPAIGLAEKDEMRAEVIDRFQNGNYKIRATKRVLYRGSSKTVSIVAVAPAVDFDEQDLINSGKLYEYKIKVAR